MMPYHMTKSDFLNTLPDNYLPHDNEPFMGDSQKVFFKKKLIAWKTELLDECQETITHMQSTENESDEIDLACKGIHQAMELRTRDRERKLIKKIDDALRRLEDGNYGFCEETGEPIGLRRLIARPIATLSIEAQERHERYERIYRDEAPNV